MRENPASIFEEILIFILRQNTSGIFEIIFVFLGARYTVLTGPQGGVLFNTEVSERKKKQKLAKKTPLEILAIVC